MVGHQPKKSGKIVGGLVHGSPKAEAAAGAGVAAAVAAATAKVITAAIQKKRNLGGIHTNKRGYKSWDTLLHLLRHHHQ
jgi:hypothetical protein